MKQGLSLPKEGSSRYYYQLKTPKKIIIDGISTKIPHGVKLASKNDMDNYHDNEPFGMQQNKTESSLPLRNFHTLIPSKGNINEYETNPHGALAPVFDYKKDGSWLEIAHVSPIHHEGISKEEHSKMTGVVHDILHHPSFPDVRSTNDLRETIVHLTHKLNNPSYKIPLEHVNRLIHHPVINNFGKLVVNSSLHSGDFSDNNFGIWKHPVKGTYHLVLHDFGTTNEIMDNYKKVFHKMKNEHSNLLETLLEKMA